MLNVSDARFPTRLTWLLFALVILLIGLTLRQNLKQIESLYLSDTLNSAIHLQDQFQRTDTFLEAMRGQAEERLRSDPQSALTRQLYSYIQQLPDQGLVRGWQATSPGKAHCLPPAVSGRRDFIWR
jgi:diguanylate cyclase